MDIIKIGEGNHGVGAIKYSDKYNFINQNDLSYWCNDVLFDMCLVIMKDTDQGKTITHYLYINVNPDSLKDYLLQIILRNISLEDFKKGLQQITKESFDLGVKYNQDQVKQILGM